MEDSQDQIERKAMRQAALEQMSPISLEEYEAKVKKWLLIEDPYILRIIPYHYIANCLAGDPVWLVVNGASGGGKSELLYMLYDLPKTFALSTLTPQTLVSGMQGKNDPSLLNKINNKIVVLKDFTTIISMQKDAQKEVIAQLREIYDGRYIKSFGTGKTVNWEGKVGMIAASTEHFDIFAMQNASMGERFIQYRLVTGDRKATAERAITNTTKSADMRMELRDAMFALIKGIDITKEVPPIPAEIRKKLISLADLATLARSAVIRDFGMKKEVIFVPSPEMPTRLAQQLARFVEAATLIQGCIKQDDLAAVYKIALDSIPKRDRLIMRQLTRRNCQTTAEVAASIGYPTSATHTVLEDISVKGLSVRIKGADSDEGGTADRWELKEEYRNILSEYDSIVKEEVIKDEDLQKLALDFEGEVV